MSKYACDLFRKRGGSCLVCLNARYTHGSFFSPPSIPPSLLSPFFQTTSNAETVCKAVGAKAKEKRTGECSSNISSQSVWWFMHYQDSFKVWFKMECLNSWIYCWGIKCEVEESNVIHLVFFPSSSLLYKARTQRRWEQNSLRPPLTHFPPPPPLRGPWVNGSECHCEGTAKKQTPKGTSEVTFSLCGQAMKTSLQE